MNSEKKKVVKVKNEFLDLTELGLSFSALFVIKIAMAYMRCGRLLLEGRSLASVDDSGEAFIFGDFSKIIALTRRLERICRFLDCFPKANKYGASKEFQLSREQIQFLRNEGVSPEAYVRFARDLWGLDVNEVSEFDTLLDPKSLRSELIRFFSDRDCLFTLLPKDLSRRGTDPEGVFLSFKQEPWHLLTKNSSVDRRTKIIIGLAVEVTEEVPQPREYDSLGYLYHQHEVRQDPRKYWINLAAEVSPVELLELSCASEEVTHKVYDLDRDVFCVTRKIIHRSRTIDSHQTEESVSASADTTREIARVLANAIQNNARLENSVRCEKLNLLGAAWKLNFDLRGVRFRRTGEMSQRLIEIFVERLEGKTQLRDDDFSALMPQRQEFQSIALKHLAQGTLPTENDFSETVLFDGKMLREFFFRNLKYRNNFPERQSVIVPEASRLIREDGTALKPYYWMDGTYHFPETLAGDLLLEFGSEPIVRFRNDDLTQAQREAVQNLEKELQLPPNSFGLDSEDSAQDILSCVHAHVPECPCCKGGKGAHSLESVIDSANFFRDLFTKEGAVLCTEAGAILQLTNRQAAFGTWNKTLQKYSFGTLLLKAYNKNGRLVLTICVDR